MATGRTMTTGNHCRPHIAQTRNEFRTEVIAMRTKMITRERVQLTGEGKQND